MMQRGDPLELNFEDLEMKNWNIPMDKTQRVDEKNGVNCLVIIFTSRVMVMKMSKMVHFCIFCWCQKRISLSLDKIFTGIWKILFSSFRKCYGLLDFELPLARNEPLKMQSFVIILLTQQFLIFLPSISHKR